jgi:hypothetical protein
MVADAELHGSSSTTGTSQTIPNTEYSQISITNANIANTRIDSSQTSRPIVPTTGQTVPKRSSSSTESPPSRRKARTGDDIGRQLIELESRKLAHLETKKKVITEEDEDNASFFKSLLPLIRGLTPIEKLRYRGRIIELTEAAVAAHTTTESSVEFIVCRKINLNRMFYVNTHDK